MKSIDIKIICPDDFELEDLAQVLEGIDIFDFYRNDGTIFNVKLKHTLIRDRLFILENT